MLEKKHVEKETCLINMENRIMPRYMNMNNIITDGVFYVRVVDRNGQERQRPARMCEATAEKIRTEVKKQMSQHNGRLPESAVCDLRNVAKADRCYHGDWFQYLDLDTLIEKIKERNDFELLGLLVILYSKLEGRYVSPGEIWERHIPQVPKRRTPRT